MPPPLPDLQLLADRYEVIKELGRGGFGVVYACKDHVTNRRVALKVLDPHRTEELGSVETRFRHEAANLARLNHPNIIRILDFGRLDDASLYLTMDLVNGENFRVMIEELKMNAALLLLVQVCDALAYMHRHGIVHCDLKPGNILVEFSPAGDQARLLDFGLSKLVGDLSALSEHGKVVGSIQCMAPEQATGAAFDHRADLFAVGVMLYRVVAGRYPFEGSIRQTLSDIVGTNPPAIGTLRPNLKVPPGLEQIIIKALEKNPENRYQSANDLRADLRRVLSIPEAEHDYPTPVYAFPRMVGPGSPAQSKPLALMAGAVVGGLIGAVLWVSLWWLIAG